VGLCVIELGVWVAAPSAAAILANWGADAIKGEVSSGDPVRHVFSSSLGGASRDGRSPEAGRAHRESSDELARIKEKSERKRRLDSSPDR